MKKIFLTLVVVSSLFSCSKDEVNEPKSVQSVKVNSQRLMNDPLFGKVFYNQEGDLKLRIQILPGNPKKISLGSAEDSKDYFILQDAEAVLWPINPNFDVYYLSKAYKFMNTAAKTPFIKKFNDILIPAAKYDGNGAARLDIAKDLSSVVLRGDEGSITFTKL
ncbi:hypothetical protein C3B47_03870 [Flavobacterium columnare]|uniref:Lipoprotein n=1 Tax=Flavobacterium columnare (strain ATCC 49512 / CIP 103533 / TG 44/87) TaxID=1041826 RepID=G8X6V2_FLACA|nr:hypothetical protein [Flavobacterium columnare]AEW85687.1 hypothetical protein FCOL_04265 [Flavobacterium columnare ATCC 49512]MBF6652045.1 hypothetical protein [Flavobacterium columnare]MBF6655955.1 hypothetical protein [Flavobacterium columnare]MBF6657605.1 hypothetical protein [Flavobacterium columnare]PTD14499.1 hypothetical protein C6N29_08675 [Flavobacterium columnare]